jgi:hypothetical protein
MTVDQHTTGEPIPPDAASDSAGVEAERFQPPQLWQTTER